MAQIKLYAALVLMLGLGVGAWYAHHVGYESGRAAVQSQWDVARVAQAQAVAKAEAQAQANAAETTKKFNALSDQYEAAIHARAPSVADSVAAGVADGTLRLRDGTDVCPGDVSAATARSRAADAAATQALSDRVATAIEIVRIGDAADARERQLSAQVIGLQAVLKAERIH